MHNESALALGKLAKLVIAIGIVGGTALCGYAMVDGGLGGLASARCSGGGCADRISAGLDRDDALLGLGAFGGGGLVIAGVIVLVALGVRARAAAAQPALPVASVITRGPERR